MNRRQFLKRMGQGAVTAGAAWGFPTIVSAAAAGVGDRPSPSNRIAMAVLGIGWMGGANLDAFLNRDDVQVLAACDIFQPHLENGANKINAKYGDGGCSTYTDFRELLQRDDLDAICISLPDHWHAIPSVMAARAGLDIYGEKPLSYSLPEGRAMVNAMQRYGRIWQTGSWQRSRDNFHRACELVRNGRIGKVERVDVVLGGGHVDFDKTGNQKEPQPVPPGFDWNMWLGPAPWAPYSPARAHKSWRWNLDYGSGMLLDWVGHHLDIAHWGLDLDHTGPVEIEGSMDFPEGLWNAPTTFGFKTRYANGIEMTIRSYGRGGTTWYGDKGSVFVTREALEATPDKILKEVIEPGEIHLTKSNDHYENFIHGIRTRQPTITPIETAHRSASVGHLCLVAGKLGRRVRWNPATEQFVNDAEADRLLGRAMRAPWHL